MTKVVFGIFRVRYIIGDTDITLMPICSDNTRLPLLFDTYEAAEEWIEKKEATDVTYTIQKLYTKL